MAHRSDDDFDHPRIPPPMPPRSVPTHEIGVVGRRRVREMRRGVNDSTPARAARGVACCGLLRAVLTAESLGAALSGKTWQSERPRLLSTSIPWRTGQDGLFLAIRRAEIKGQSAET
jgi:hypothetical protein